MDPLSLAASPSLPVRSRGRAAKQHAVGGENPNPLRLPCGEAVRALMTSQVERD